MNYQLHLADRSTSGLVTVSAGQSIAAEVAALSERLESVRLHNIGFPGSADVDHAVLSELLTRFLLNNIGDPFVDGLTPNHTKLYERRVLDLVAELFRAPADGWWGCITHGSTEGTLHALRIARDRYPDGIVFHSRAAHYSVPKAANLLALPTMAVATTDRGAIDHSDLEARLSRDRSRTPIIVATAGTTMTEAIDDLHGINYVCDRLGITTRFVHTDAALSGIPLALLPSSARPGFDLCDGADSIVVSGHKFLSSLMPSGVLIIKRNRMCRDNTSIDYISDYDSTIPSSRNGHLALLLWQVLRRSGMRGLRERAEQARRLAIYAERRLREEGWPAWRHPHAFTVVLRTPPPGILDRWPIPSSGGWSHIICMPGITRDQVDKFIEEIAAAARTATPLPGIGEAGSRKPATKPLHKIQPDTFAGSSILVGLPPDQCRRPA